MREDQSDRYETCFALYKKYEGRRLVQIEREMRLLGFTDFHRRILYGRRENGTYKPGWIERYGWKEAKQNGSPPHKGGLAAASADGVVLADSAEVRPELTRGSVEENHPVSQAKNACPPPLLGKEGSFEAWLKQVSPEYNWTWKHQQYIYRHLERITSGENKRLMIFLPPRHGKSELVTVRYPGWRLWNDPAMRIIVSSYNQKLADKFSRGIRKLLSEEEGRLAALSCANVATTPSACKMRTHPPLLRRGGEKDDSRLPSLSEEGGRPDAFYPADGVVSTPTGERASDACIRQACDHPQCTAGTAAGQNYHPHGKAEPFSRSDGRPDERSPRMFPRTRTINTASQWETAAGGGVKAAGVGAGVTGFGGQLIIIDDPVKNRAEAESETYREKMWDWYRNDLYTRLEPNGSIILIQTRWHEDDLAGRLLKEMQNGGDQWEVVNLPALSESKSYAFTREPPREPHNVNRGLEIEASDVDRSRECLGGLTPEGVTLTLGGLTPEGVTLADPLGRPAGAALCPERYDEKALDDIRRQLGGYAFSALYQQRPTPAEGGIFKRAWFKRFVDRAPEGLKWKRGYDLAVSTRTTSCFTSSVRVAYDDAGNMYIADGFRERIEFPDQKRYILSRLAAEPDTEHGIEMALHGQAIIQDLRRDPSTRGAVLRGVNVTADKVTRALKWAPLAEEGKVILVRGAWNQAFLDEICNFPGGQYDDQVDAVSLAVTMFGGKGRSVHTF